VVDDQQRELTEQATSGPESARNSPAGEVVSSRAASEAPESPGVSDHNCDSCHSSYGTTGSAGNSGNSGNSEAASVKTDDSKAQHATRKRPRKNITATIELQKAGFLPGDNIPLKITVNHTKYIKSIN